MASSVPGSQGGAPAVSSPRSPLRRFLIRLLLAAVLVPPILLAAYTFAMLSFSYSKGERVGYVQKFSHKGWICKTWEGELAMVILPGAMPEIFYFTVRDDAVVQKINGSLGKKVVLHYEQHVGLPTSCFGDTPYFATDVRIVEP